MLILSHGCRNIPLYPQRDKDQINIIIKTQTHPSKFINQLSFQRILQILSPPYYERCGQNSKFLFFFNLIENSTLDEIYIQNFLPKFGPKFNFVVKKSSTL